MKLARILAAVDRFPQDEAVLLRAMELAQRHDARVTVVHVVDLPVDTTLRARLDTLQGQAEFAARDRIGEALRRLPGDASGMEIRIEHGSAALRLIELCDEMKPDLVIMRAHQRMRIADRILGSTTDRVIAATKPPVLVVKTPAEDPYVKAWVATDGRDDAEGALHFVGSLLPDAALHLVQVVQIPPQLQEAMLRSGTDEAGFHAHRTALVRTARNRMAALAAMAPWDVRTHVLRGEPAASLVRASRIADVDLIAAGRGRSSLLRRAFIGSVTRRLLRDASSDVLIYRAPNEND